MAGAAAGAGVICGNAAGMFWESVDVGTERVMVGVREVGDLRENMT